MTNKTRIKVLFYARYDFKLWHLRLFLSLWHLQADELLQMWDRRVLTSRQVLPVSKGELLVLVTQVPSCLYASPSICPAQFSPGKAGNLSALCLFYVSTNRKLQSERNWFWPTYKRETFILGESIQNMWFFTFMVQISATCFVCLKHFSR